MPVVMKPKQPPTTPQDRPDEAQTLPPTDPQPPTTDLTTANDAPAAMNLTVDTYARYHDIARRLIMQQTPAEIAAVYGMSVRQMRRVVRKPEMLQIFRQVHDEMMGDLDKLIKDEKISPLLRARAQAIRMQTVLQEVVDEVQSRIKEGRAKATEMKVAADVAFGIIDRAKSELSTVQAKGGGGGVNVSLSISGDNKKILAQTIDESGLDLSDITDAEVVEEDPDDGQATQES